MAVLRVQDQAQELGSSSATTPPSIVCASADLGWSQANNLLDLSPDQLFVDFLLADPNDPGSFLSFNKFVSTTLTVSSSL